ncbi:MAG: hypothetical protein A2086_15095 [Spirochaetes bacterium GWD1_27_9]|nr:MAG: hypothetical protein A2Z98_00110 [Spirochaetes bacterium GWB1_27_13]OHD31090.1 MAG: hypothetical protein A2086_15095 [Spirochaetes bacterium GWD1_27_9]
MRNINQNKLVFFLYRDYCYNTCCEINKIVTKNEKDFENRRNRNHFDWIDFSDTLKIPILGVKNFLSNFVLTINYPEKYFNLEKN